MFSVSLRKNSSPILRGLLPTALLLLASTAGHAQVTLTFEELPNPTGGGFGYNGQATPYTGNGFTISDDFGGLHSVAPDAGPTIYNYTGSVALWSGGDGSTLTITHDNAVPFTLNSLDIANLTQDNSGVTVVFTGNQQGGGTLTKTFLHGANNGLETVNFSGWSNLTSVTFQQGNSFNQFDNVVLNGGTPAATTPEPGSVALLTVLSASGLALARRRRKA